MTRQSTKPNVLIVDDEKSNLKLLSEILKEDANVLIAKNGTQAINKAIQLQPTLILLDVVMPQMDGFEVIQSLKSNKQTHLIPVIFITGLDDIDSEQRGFSLGASDYIQKPFHANIVKARVNLHLKLARQSLMLEDLANIDPLTSLPNRRKFDQTLELEWLAARRDGTSMTIIMVDINQFKQYNDFYGHSACADVLNRVGHLLSEQFGRPRDLVARFSNEEFAVILPNTVGDTVVEKMTECRQSVAKLSIPHYNSIESDVVTINLGGASAMYSEQMTLTQLLYAAEQQLLLSKEAGSHCALWQQLN